MPMLFCGETYIDTAGQLAKASLRALLGARIF